MKTFAFTFSMLFSASCDLPASSGRGPHDADINDIDTSGSCDAGVFDADVDAISGADPGPFICHSRYTDTVPAVTSPGRESFWNFTVPGGQCLAAICIRPDEDEFSLIIPPYLYYSPDRRIDLVQVVDDEGTGINEWCAQWRELRPFPDLGAWESKMLTIRNRTYQPSVTLYY